MQPRTRLATIAAIEQCKGPVYIRFGREAMPDFHFGDLGFEIGKSQMLKTGNDLTIIANRAHGMGSIAGG